MQIGKGMISQRQALFVFLQDCSAKSATINGLYLVFGIWYDKNIVYPKKKKKKKYFFFFFIEENKWII